MLVGKPKDPAKIEQRLQAYRGQSGVVTKHLELGLWYLKNKRLFFLTIVWLLAIIAAVLWSYSIYYFASYLLVGRQQDLTLQQSLKDRQVNPIGNPYDENLVLEPVAALALDNNLYDLVVKATNNNTNRRGTISYYWILDGRQYGPFSSFILPNETKYFLSLAVELETSPSSLELKLNKANWSILNAHRIPDWQFFKDNHLNFDIKDKEFVPARQSDLSDNLPINYLTYQIANLTPYYYRQAKFNIVLLSGTKIVAVERHVIENFQPRQIKQVNLSIVGSLPNITSIYIQPDINIFDNSIYNPIQAS